MIGMGINRAATIQDRDGIRGVYLRAFPEGESEIVSKLAVDLLFEETTPKTISLVAEAEGTVAGHAAFSPVIMEPHANHQGYILAPLAVDPDYQKKGIGSHLVDDGIQQLSAMGVNIVFVYGDPKYYSRFGFGAEAAHRYTAPYKLQYPFGWQAAELNECRMEKLCALITCVTPLCDPKLW